ncbi:MAG: hypothetical protein PHV34_19680 [Verrucomicrobiae bacterium]|nr:hypothetical protein [Verrucomicrobiae bacterium]
MEDDERGGCGTADVGMAMDQQVNFPELGFIVTGKPPDKDVGNVFPGWRFDDVVAGRRTA